LAFLKFSEAYKLSNQLYGIKLDIFFSVIDHKNVCICNSGLDYTRLPQAKVSGNSGYSEEFEKQQGVPIFTHPAQM
jgi:hypothetical protein